MKAEIIAIGTEILLGEIVDTNSAFIARQLPELGIDLNYTSVVGDNLARLTQTLERAWNRSELVITTGGLGPTEDDMTREATAALLGETPYIDEELERRVRAFFATRGPMPESNLKQAWLISSCRAISNPRGTAPGWWTERDGHVIVSMPGVPGEMERMWNNEVRPELERRSDGQVLVTRTIKTVGIGEGSVDEMAKPLYGTPGIGIGTYARQDGIHLRIGAKGVTREDAWRLIQPVEEQMNRIFGTAIWGRDDDTLEGAIGDLLIARRETLGSMESCTGGLFASTMTETPGASEYFFGGLVTYSTELKLQMGVNPGVIEEFGVVSPETASEMARATRRLLNTSYAVGITGVLGPDTQEGKAPGTVFIAVADPSDGTSNMAMSMNQGRAAVKRRAVTTALLLLRRTLLASDVRA